MNGNARDEDRRDRDRERSTEAHWRAAEAAAEDEPTQKTPEEIPVPARDDAEEGSLKLVQPEKTP